jgi:flagellar hook-associated protein 1 FlgK
LDYSGAPGGLFFTAPPTSGVNAAANMTVAITDPSKIAAASVPVPPATFAVGDNTNALALADIQNQAVTDNETPIDYYSNFVSELGNEVAGTTAQNSAQQTVLNQLQQQVSSTSGVSLDEEAVNLIQFQRAYEASARIISTIDSLTSTAINMGTGA